jgi:uncharacterized protein (TIGR02217 family)
MASVTVLSDVILTEDFIAASGARGKNNRRNDRGELLSGAQRINVGWTRTRREYEIATVPMPREAWLTVETVHEVTDSGAYGFLFEDPKDSSVTTAAGYSQGLVVALSATTFQLYQRKRYGATSRYRDRKITRPREDTVEVFVGGVAATFSVDADAGIVTIAAAPDEADVTWNGRFYVPVHFQDDFIDWELVVPNPDEDGRWFNGPSVLLQEILE